MALLTDYRTAANDILAPDPEVLERGLAIHERVFALDTFGFLPSVSSPHILDHLMRLVKQGLSAEEARKQYDISRRQSQLYHPESRETFLGAIKATGLNGMVLTVGSEMDLHHSLNRISCCIQLLDELSDHLVKATSVAAIEQARAEGKFSVVCSSNCAPAQSGTQHGLEDLDWIDVFYRFGIRLMHLTYNRRNWVGDGCLEPTNGGLSLHGREVVARLNTLGVVVDTAHSGKQTTLDAATYSTAPIMATHTTCEALVNHPRAKSDEEFKAIADTGGLIGICCIPAFLGKSSDVSSLLDHVVHAVEVVGMDHVTIGTDRTYNGPLPKTFEDEFPRGSALDARHWFGNWTPEDLEHLGTDTQRNSLEWTNWPYFTVGLLQRGFLEEDIAKLLGGNFLRVLGAVEQAATYAHTYTGEACLGK